MTQQPQEDVIYIFPDELSLTTLALNTDPCPTLLLQRQSIPSTLVEFDYEMTKTGELSQENSAAFEVGILRSAVSSLEEGVYLHCTHEGSGAEVVVAEGGEEVLPSFAFALSSAPVDAVDTSTPECADEDALSAEETCQPLKGTMSLWYASPFENQNDGEITTFLQRNIMSGMEDAIFDPNDVVRKVVYVGTRVEESSKGFFPDFFRREKTLGVVGGEEEGGRPLSQYGILFVVMTVMLTVLVFASRYWRQKKLASSKGEEEEHSFSSPEKGEKQVVGESSPFGNTVDSSEDGGDKDSDSGSVDGNQHVADREVGRDVQTDIMAATVTYDESNTMEVGEIEVCYAPS